MSDAFEIQYSSRERIWSKLNKCLLVFIGAGIALPLLYRSLPVVKEKTAQDARVKELEDQIESSRMKNNRLRREVSEWRHTDRPDHALPRERQDGVCQWTS